MKVINIKACNRYDEFIIVAYDDLTTITDDEAEKAAEEIHKAFLAGISATTWNKLLEKMIKYQQTNDNI